MKTNRNAATTPGQRQRQRDAPKRLQAARAEVARRLEQAAVEALERDEDRQRDEREPDVAEHEHHREPAVEQLRDRVVGRPEPGPEEERVDDALVAEDHLPGEHAQQVARQERRDQEQQQDVLPLRPGEREVVRERIGEHDDDRRDDQRHLHRLPEEPEVDRAVEEVVPGREREAVRAREERVDVEAVRGDDRDRDDEEDDEPGERQAEQARRRQVEPQPPAAPGSLGRVERASARQEAFTSSHSFA